MKITYPTLNTLASGRVYRTSAATNVRETWLAAGWQPPSRERQRAEMKRLNPLPIPEGALA